MIINNFDFEFDISDQAKILQIISDNPGIEQRVLHDVVRDSRLSRKIKALLNKEEIRRVKNGQTYKLYKR